MVCSPKSIAGLVRSEAMARAVGLKAEFRPAITCKGKSYRHEPDHVAKKP